MTIKGKSYKYRGKDANYGQVCTVLSKGKFWNDILVEFENGQQRKVARGLLMAADKSLKSAVGRGRPARHE